jgi:branched-subunit amino acid transport protein
MTTGWIVVFGLFVGVYGLKAAGPLLLGERRLPPALQRASNLLPAALLGAIVATSTLADGSTLRTDARLVGVAAAAVALWRRRSFIVVVTVAAAATALARAVS